MDRKIKILYFITKSETGGAQTHVWQVSRYMKEQGNRVAVMSYPGGWLESESKKLGVAFYPNKFLSNSYNPFQLLLAGVLLRYAVRDFQPDLVSCHSSAAGFIGRISIRNKVPTIFTAHGLGYAEGVPFVRKYGMIVAEKIAARYSQKIICVSHEDRERLLRYQIVPSEKVCVIHNGVEIEEGEVKRHGETDRLRIVFVGRLAGPKDPLLFLQAFAALPVDLRGHAEVCMIGDGPKRRQVENYVEKNGLGDRIQILGRIQKSAVLGFLRKSDIFVLVSKWEGLPRSILEAMSVGLPVIATDVGGVRETIGEECGILVKRGDKQGVVKALERLIRDENLRRKMGEAGRKRVGEGFSLERMLSKTEELYREILS